MDYRLNAIYDMIDIANVSPTDNIFYPARLLIAYRTPDKKSEMKYFMLNLSIANNIEATNLYLWEFKTIEYFTRIAIILSE